LLTKCPFGKPDLHQDNACLRSVRRCRHPRPLLDDQFYSFETFPLLFIRSVANAHKGAPYCARNLFAPRCPGWMVVLVCMKTPSIFLRGEYKAKEEESRAIVASA